MTQPSRIISSKEEFRAWRRADLEGAGLARWRFGMALRHPTMHFLRVLRRVEYLKNCGRGPMGRMAYLIATTYFRLLSIYMSFTIPPNTCGPGLRLNHWGTIVISPEARIGVGARINVCVNIGLGAMLFGGIRLGDGVRVGANAVVNKSFPDGAILAGVPARMIGQRSSEKPPVARST